MCRVNSKACRDFFIRIYSQYSKKLATHNDVTVAAYVFIPGNNNTVTRDGSQATDGW